MNIARKYIENARSLRDQNDATRITLRMIASNGLLIPDINEEARVPLSKDWNGHEIVYLADNHPERISPKGILKQEDELVRNIIESTSIDNDLDRIRNDGYKIEILNSVTPEDLKQIYEVYQKSFTKYLFEMTLENIRSLVTNPNGRASIVRNSDGKIVSICVAETAKIATNRGTLYICELSDEATHPEYRRRGLNRVCINRLIKHLYEGDKIDLIFEEARAPHIGVNRVAVKLGFVYAGRLQKHCVIGGTKRNTRN